MQKYKFTIISLIIIIVAAIPLLLLSKKPNTSMTQPTPSPTVAPLNEQNADSTLETEDQQIKQAMDQTTVDLNAVSQIDTSQDSTAGL
ncbi:MAG TPA: hypothetical protein VF189_02400 [Patescibacteria group bacterium]